MTTDMKVSENKTKSMFLCIAYYVYFKIKNKFCDFFFHLAYMLLSTC